MIYQFKVKGKNWVITYTGCEVRPKYLLEIVRKLSNCKLKITKESFMIDLPDKIKP